MGNGLQKQKFFLSLRLSTFSITVEMFCCFGVRKVVTLMFLQACSEAGKGPIL